MARNTLTQKLWGDTGEIEVVLDAHNLSEGQRAGLAFISGDEFGWIAIERTNGKLRIAWTNGQGPEVGEKVILAARYEADMAILGYRPNENGAIENVTNVQLKFACWKGARPGIFCFGPGGGWADVDYFRYRIGAAEKT
jgi:hypothetical protein